MKNFYVFISLICLFTSIIYSKEPIAKGVYSVNSQGYSQYGYTGYGGDYIVDIEFYDDHITVGGIWCDYKDNLNGNKRYESSLRQPGNASRTYYIVDSDFNVEQQMYVSSAYGSNWVTYQMAKGADVVFPKHQINGGGYENQQSHGSSESYNNTNSQPNKTRSCTYCNGSGKCKTCTGTHHYVNPLTNKYVTCPNCKTDGKCTYCGGTGKIK